MSNQVDSGFSIMHVDPGPPPLVAITNAMTFVVLIIGFTRLLRAVYRLVRGPVYAGPDYPPTILPKLSFLFGFFGTLYLLYGLFDTIMRRGGADLNAISGSLSIALVPIMVGTCDTSILLVTHATANAINRFSKKKAGKIKVDLPRA